MGVAALALGWTVAGLITLVLLLLLTQGLFMPECSSYDRDGQRVAQVGAGLVAVLLLGIWVAAVTLLRHVGARPLVRLLLAAALPFGLVTMFAIGASVTGELIERVAPSGDHAMCW